MSSKPKKSELWLFAVVLSAAILVTSCAEKKADTGEELTISAAASLTDVFQTASREFQQKYPAIHVVLNFGSSGALVSQIENGAPVDVIALAGTKPLQRLLAGGSVAQEDVHIFARNSLVLIEPKDLPAICLPDLATEKVKRICIADPDLAPVGQYAKESLIAAGLWEQLQPKLILVKDTRQVLQYVSQGEVDAGFVYSSDLVPQADTKIAELIADGLHSPIEYPIALLKGSSHKKAAALWINFLLSAEGKEILQQYGFK